MSGNGRNRTKTNGNGKTKQSNGAKNGASRNGGRTPRFTNPIGISNASGNTRAVNNQTMRMSGSDFYSKITVKGAPITVADRILFNEIVSPSALIGTRLAQIAPTWERYFFTKFNLRYVPAVPTTLACQLCAYIDTDPLDSPSLAASADQLVRQAVAHTGAQQWNFISPKVTPLPLRSDRVLYYTGLTPQNERLAYQGRAFVIQITNPLDIAGVPVGSDLECGSIFIDWVVEFQTPQLSPDVTALYRIPSFFQAKHAIPRTQAVSGLALTIPDLKPGTLVYASLVFDIDTLDSGPITSANYDVKLRPMSANIVPGYPPTNELRLAVTTSNNGTIQNDIGGIPTVIPLLVAADGTVAFSAASTWDETDLSCNIDSLSVSIVGEQP